MGQIKISELTEKTTISDNDVFSAVDTDNATNVKIQASTMKSYNNKGMVTEEELTAEKERLNATKDDINSLIPKDSVSDSSINIESAADYPFIDLTINGNSTQNTTIGKNLLDITPVTEPSITGLTFSHTESSFTLNGTPNTSWFNDELNNMPNIEADETYTFSRNVSGTNPSMQTTLRFKNSDNTNLVILGITNNTSQQVSHTFTQDEVDEIDHVILTIEDLTVDSAYDLSCTLQLEKGDTATDYEPFTYGASPNPGYPQEIQSVGTLNSTDDKYYTNLKIINNNLFNENDIVTNMYLNSTNGNEVSSKYSNISGFIKVKANSNYTLNYDYETLLSQNSRGYVYYDDSKEILSCATYIVTDKKILFSVSSDGYIRFCYDKNITNIEFNEIKSISIPLGTEPLRKIDDYADKITVNMKSGAISRINNIKKVIFNGSEDWKMSYGTGLFHMNEITNQSQEKTLAISDKYLFSKITSSIYNSLPNHYFCKQPNYNSIFFKHNEFSTINEFKEWLTSNNVEVNYIMNSSTTEEVGTLSTEDLAKLRTFLGINNIYIDDSRNPIIDLTYALDFKTYIENLISSQATSNTSENEVTNE